MFVKKTVEIFLILPVKLQKKKKVKIIATKPRIYKMRISKLQRKKSFRDINIKL